MPTDILKSGSREGKVALETSRPIFCWSAPGRMNLRMGVALVWVVGMAGLIWWATSRDTSGSKTEADTLPWPAASAQAIADAGKPWKVSLPGNAALNMVWITPGAFLMGSPAMEAGRVDNEGPQTQVTLTKGFWLGECEVTQGQWRAVMGSNPSYFSSAGKNGPVEQVAWDEAMTFCQKLTAQERAMGRLPEDYAFTLPTEAQWEYACRAGTTGPYAGNLDAMAWYKKNSGQKTQPVGTKQPNAWGLYDMQGNVKNWCADWYTDELPGGSVTDPIGLPSANNIRAHVYCGGSWGEVAEYCRSAVHSCLLEGGNQRSRFIGFRVALSPVPAGR